MFYTGMSLQYRYGANADKKAKSRKRRLIHKRPPEGHQAKNERKQHKILSPSSGFGLDGGDGWYGVQGMPGPV